LCRYMAELLVRKWRRMDARAKTAWTLSELEGAFVLGAFLEASLAGEGPDPAATVRALGDRDALGSHVADLLELVAAELRARMTPDEWLNREQQLREGCHFGWVRPGVPQQASLLLAARPRRSHAAGSSGRSITAIRQKAAARAAPPGLSRLVRGRPKPAAAQGGPGDLAAALGTGTGGSAETSDGSDSGDGTDSDNDSDGSAASGDSDGSSSDGGSFVVSDSDDSGRRRRSQKRRSAQIDGPQTKRAARPQNARQRIAERLKLKL
ncbi:hypothetical protein H4R21_004630, partial [Coemansia helicoidea]